MGQWQRHGGGEVRRGERGGHQSLPVRVPRGKVIVVMVITASAMESCDKSARKCHFVMMTVERLWTVVMEWKEGE